MSLSNNKYLSNKKSLPMDSPVKRGTPFYICPSGSLSVEAAVVIPLFTGFLIALLFFFRVLQIETAVAESLSYAGRMTAVEASGIESEAAQLATAEVLFRKEIAQYPVVKQYVGLDGQGITMVGSSVKGDYIKLCATYKVKLPISFFRVTGFRQLQRSCSRKWTGKIPDSGDGDNDPYVYYTKTGKVYHRTKLCPYLDLSIHKIKLSEVDSARNKGGSRYKACSKCGKASVNSGWVYITDYGTIYHNDIGCSSLKRTIFMVKLSEVGDRPPCSKCYGGSKE